MKKIGYLKYKRSVCSEVYTSEVVHFTLPE